MDLPETVTKDLDGDDDSLPVSLADEVPDKLAASAQVGFTDWGSPVEVAVPKRAKPVSEASGVLDTASWAHRSGRCSSTGPPAS